MPYNETIEGDLRRAKGILEEGKLTVADLEGVSAPVIISLSGGAIVGKDIYVAYKLLESFVAEIERRNQHFCVRCHHRWEGEYGPTEYCGDCHRDIQAERRDHGLRP
jgi:hypothetical protein